MLILFSYSTGGILVDFLSSLSSRNYVQLRCEALFRQLYYNAYRYSYRPSIGVDNLRVVRARKLLGCLSVFRLCQFL